MIGSVKVALCDRRETVIFNKNSEESMLFAYVAGWVLAYWRWVESFIQTDFL